MHRIQIATLWLLLLCIGSAAAESITPDAITVTDGDTIQLRGRAVRIVGFDAPETGERTRCEAERTPSHQAS